MIRHRHLIAAVGTFLLGCAFLLLVIGCSGTRSQAPKKEQGRSLEATASEAARCEGTRTLHLYYDGKTFARSSGREEDLKKEGKTDWGVYTTNDIPGCPKGGLLVGTDNPDKLDGYEGDDKIRGLGARDEIYGGEGDDVIYGGEGKEAFIDGEKGDDVIHGGEDHDEISGGSGEDVIYGGDGDDFIMGASGKDVIYGGDGDDDVMMVNTVNSEDWGGDGGQRDELYCGAGRDTYEVAKMNKNDFVSSDCEQQFKPWRGIP